MNAARRRGGPVSDLLRGLTHGLESTNSVREGLKALEIALAFHESFSAGGAEIPLPLAKSALKINSR